MTRHAAEVSVRSSSVVMAAGTIVSRMSGFVRSAMLTAAIGNKAHADIFNVANTVPNMLYILLAGGIFNAVLVPQLVRAIKNDRDRGEAYTSRIITLAGLFLGAVTVVLVAAAPVVIWIIYQGHTSADVASTVAFARYCLPQVFFYGMFVLIGQVLNAHGRFGPMMWAPIANNVISVAVLALYLVAFGSSSTGAYSSSQELLLGVGSTLGIVVQFLVLLPYMRAAGLVYRPRFDFLHTGLGHTFSLGFWTILVVVVNQAAYIIVTRLASAASAHNSAGYTIYSNSILVTQVPHSVITVSLATAILPRLSATGASADVRRFTGMLSSTLRSSLAVVVPVAVLLPVIAVNLAHVLFGLGAGGARGDYALYKPTLIALAPALVFFAIQYLLMRGYYAIEHNKMAFWIQAAIALVNIVAAVVLVGLTSAEHHATALAVAYGLSYAVGALLAYRGLSRRIGSFDGAGLFRFFLRILIAAAISGVAAWVVAVGAGHVLSGNGWVRAVVLTAVAGIVDIVVLVLVARVMRITEVTELLGSFAGRLRRS